MIISLIAAVGKNHVIGKGGGLPWHLPADLKRFKSLTLGKPVVMGRKTYESIGHPLTKRKNIVITTNESYQAPGCHVVHSAAQAITTADSCEELMIIGGATIYELFLPLADRIYLTEIDKEYDGDTFFPELESEVWEEHSRESQIEDGNPPLRYHFVLYKRRESTDGLSQDGISS